MKKLVVIGGFAALIAAAAAAAFGASGAIERPLAAPVVTRQVYKSVAEASSFRVACPAGWVATSGTAVAAGQATGITESWAAGVRGWAFRTISPREATAVVTCIRLNQALSLSSRDATKFVRLGEGQILTTLVTCPSGHDPVGAGFELEVPPGLLRSLVPPPATWIAFTTMKSVAHGWRFGMAAYRAAEVGLLVRCVRTPAGHVLRTARASKRVHVPARRSQRLRHRCRGGSSPLFAGWTSPRREVSVRGTIGRYQQPLYFLANPTDQDATVSLDLLCVENRAQPGR